MRPQSFYENKRHHAPEDQTEGNLRECKDCFVLFAVSDQQAAWFAQRALCVPRRCPECRRERREQAASQ